jgi:phosphoribosyl-ATP pyrophosphohydrolase
MMVRFQKRCLIQTPFSSLSMPNDVLDRLMLELHQRVASLPEGSYTTKLLQGGIPKMGEKLLEESNEVIEAAAESGEPGREHTIREAADVVFHLWVLLASRGIVVDDVRRELELREGVSGLEEKRRRGQETVS